jgi:hypothetical protein
MGSSTDRLRPSVLQKPSNPKGLLGFFFVDVACALDYQ